VDEAGRLLEYRVGDWRIIGAIVDDILRILVLRIGNQRGVYR
jgi:mRNA interferase RelE/StbE